MWQNFIPCVPVIVTFRNKDSEQQIFLRFFALSELHKLIIHHLLARVCVSQRTFELCRRLFEAFIKAMIPGPVATLMPFLHSVSLI
jgi:hypothetical protein